MIDNNEYTGKTFKSGNSVALRLPKGLGVPEGIEVRMVREARMTFRVEPLNKPERKIDLAGIYGSIPGLARQPFDHKEPVWDENRAKRG
jgi:antitoxin VapB